jgi:N-acetylglucosamine-6-sulfatase
MTRRRIVIRCFVLGVVLGVLGTLTVINGQSDTAVAVQQQAKPNIVVIMVDDMRADDLSSPAMADTRKIVGTAAGNGASYDKAYAAVPNCCPSRATFLTGQYPHNHGVEQNSREPELGGGWHTFHDTGVEAEALPVWMRTAGYQNVLIGKYLNAYNGGDSGVEYPHAWDHFAAFLRIGYKSYSLNVNGTEVGVQGGYSTTDITRRAKNQLNQRLPSGKPLFMFLTPFAPHFAGNGEGEPCDVPAEPKYAGTSNPGLPDSGAFNEFAVQDKPSWITRSPRLTQGQVDQIRSCNAQRHDSLKSVDDMVVAVRNRLAAHGELGNTVLIFMSDNGYMLGEHRVVCCKKNPYEEASRIPLLVRGYGPTGVQGRMVSNVDVTATIAEAAGATPLRTPDGRSITADISGVPGSRAVLLEKREFDNASWLPSKYAGVRVNGSWSYVEYGDGSHELYNLGTDPDQRESLHADPAYNEVQTTLDAATEELRDCAGFLPDPAASVDDCNVVVTIPALRRGQR